GLKLGANLRRGGFQQLEEVLARQIAALAERQGQLAIVAGAAGQLAIARERKPRAFILYDLMNNPLVTALDQDIRYLFAQLQALGDCVKVVLAFGCGIFNEVVVGQALRMDKNGLRNLDRIVEGERANEHRRSL